MSDIPKTPGVDLNRKMQNVLKASRAVRAGIATHTQKEAVRKREAHARLEAERKVREQGKA